MTWTNPKQLTHPPPPVLKEKRPFIIVRIFSRIFETCCTREDFQLLNDKKKKRNHNNNRFNRFEILLSSEHTHQTFWRNCKTLAVCRKQFHSCDSSDLGSHINSCDSSTSLLLWYNFEVHFCYLSNWGLENWHDKT